MAVSKQAQRSIRKGRGPGALVALLLIAAIFIAAPASQFLWPEPPINPKKPSTWPVNAERAVVLARGRTCPQNAWVRNIAGTPWRHAGTWQKPGEAGTSPAEGSEPAPSGDGILCLRADRDFGELRKIGTGAEDAPNSALYLAVTPKEGSCPSGANYETAQYCLTETKLPPAPDIAP